MTTTGTGRAGDPTVQVPEGLLREIALKMCSVEPGTTTKVAGVKMTHGFHGSNKPCQWCLHDASNALAALWAACEVREQSHMWLGDNTRTGRALILRFPLPDLPIPPAPEGLAELIRSRIGPLPATLPWEALDEEHAEHEDFVRRTGRCFADHDCPHLVAEAADDKEER